MPVKQERAPEPLFSAIDYQQRNGPLAMQSSSSADLLTDIQITDLHGLLPQGFHGELPGSQIDNPRPKLPAKYPLDAKVTFFSVEVHVQCNVQRLSHSDNCSEYIATSK